MSKYTDEILSFIDNDLSKEETDKFLLHSENNNLSFLKICY